MVSKIFGIVLASLFASAALADAAGLNIGQPTRLILPSTSTGSVASTSDNLGVFDGTTSAELAATITDETGTGALVFATSPVLVTPNLGTPSVAVLTSATGLPLTSGVTGVLPIASGGTNKALTLAAGGLAWTDADSFEVGAAGVTGTIAISGGTGAPTWLAYKDAQSNTYLGPTAGAALTSGATNNTFIGSGAGAANTNGDFNTAIGNGAGALLDGSATAGNTLVGASAGAAIISDGISNTAIGRNAGVGITTGDRNVMAGLDAGDTVTTGNNNVIVGNGADGTAASTASATVIGDGATGPSGSVVLGLNALAGSGTDGVVIGNDAGQSLVSGIDNVFIGHSAGNAWTSGTRAVAVGVDANANTTSASSSVAVGDTARAATNSVAVGGLSEATGSTSVTVGYDAGGAGASNTSIGYQAGDALASGGDNNTVVGGLAGSGITTGDRNTVVGQGSASAMATGNDNTVVGSNINAGTTTVASNTLLGANIGNNASGAGGLLTTGSSNVVVGYGNDVATAAATGAVVIGIQAVGGSSDVVIGNLGTSNGSHNVMIGDSVGYASIPTATGTVAIGDAAAQTLSSGINNTLVGKSADVSTGTFTNSVALGASASATASNTAQIGNSSVTSMTLGDATRFQVSASNGTKIKGTTTNDAAASTIVGEYLAQSRTFTNRQSITTATAINTTATALTLTAGDWDIAGACGFVFAATTSVTSMICAISSSAVAGSATLPGADTIANGNASTGEFMAEIEQAASVPTANGEPTIQIPGHRVSISASTTFYLVQRATFSLSTAQGFGSIWARRAR